MGAITQSPLRLAGANLSSGAPNTGEMPFIRGGAQTFCVYSGYNSGTILSVVSPRGGAVGVSGDILVCSGAGRLNSISINLPLTSGIPCYCYDAVAAKSGGPLSGMNIIGLVPGMIWLPGASGVALNWSPAPILIDTPFYSGLCVSIKSGMAPFTLTFTPESNPASGGIKG